MRAHAPEGVPVSLSNLGQIFRERLEELSEIELQSTVVEPLLHASGFEAVRDVSGPNEKGRDLVAIKTELGTEHFYAIQVKKLKVSGKVEDPQSLMGLLYQLDQAIHEEAFDPNTLAKRTPDRLIFITPFTISRASLDAALEKYRTLSRNQVTVIDGTTLASEVLRLLPDLAASFSDTLGYRLRLASEHNVIPESRSFGVPAPLTLKEIFVEADYACLDDLEALLREFLEVDPIRLDRRPPILRPACTEQELDFLAQREAQWSKVSSPRCLPDGYTLEGFMESLIAHATRIVDSISNFTAGDGDDKLDEIHSNIAVLQAAVKEIRKIGLLAKRSHLLSLNGQRCVADAYETLRLRRRLLTYRHLYRSNSVIAITGVAGAGKTTLIRTLLTKASEEDKRREVVFARAIDIHDSSAEGLLGHLLVQRNRGGGNLTPKQFRSMMTDGKVRIMIDGLDEAGDRAQKLAYAILDLTRSYGRCPVAVTARETEDLSEWRSAIHLKLCPFSDAQLADFVGRWFSAKPSARDGLQRWLERNPAMREIARTPLVAALMCSLYDVGEAAMPLSETDLYERRLDFLLGRWEQAKTIPPMPEKARNRYLLFLMHLAHIAHDRQVRSLEYSQVVRLTTRFMTPGFNPNASALIRDCIGRGLLVLDINGEYSLGHLVHQEFLVGRYMQKYNNVDVIGSRLGIDWWRRPLLFYASLIGDVSALLQRLNETQRRDHYWQLKDLVQAAAETPPDAL